MSRRAKSRASANPFSGAPWIEPSVLSKPRDGRRKLTTRTQEMRKIAANRQPEAGGGIVSSVNEEQPAFWGAVVQIIPVLLLAIVIEARALKRADRVALRLYFRSLRARHGSSRTRDRIRVAAAMTLKVGVVGFAPAYAMLGTSILLVFSEVLGLSTLASGQTLPPWASITAIVAIVAGVGATAVAPVALRFAEAWRDTDPDGLLGAVVVQPSIQAESAKGTNRDHFGSETLGMITRHHGEGPKQMRFDGVQQTRGGALHFSLRDAHEHSS
jgi:hypothetical protein